MSTILKLRRGITSAIAAFTGAQGEVAVDITKNTLVVQDGATVGGFPLARTSDVSLGTPCLAVLGGTANAITGSLALSAPAYANGQPFILIASLANTGAVAAVLTLGGTAQASVPVVKGNNLPLVAGDIPAAGYPIQANYSSTFGAIVMQNPATGVSVAGNQIQPIAASVAANALTVTLNPTALTFRSTTLNSGATVALSVAAAISLVVPSGASLGTISTEKARLALVALDNAGTVVLGIANLTGGVNLDETTLVSTTAISSGATSAGVIYSASALTNVPFRVVGSVDITEATAGTWATAPTTVQGVGGQALAALSSLGYGQTWQDVTASRAFGVTNYNTTGKPIAVSIYFSQQGVSANADIVVNGVVVNEAWLTPAANASAYAIVPAGGSYSVPNASGTYGLIIWAELR